MMRKLISLILSLILVFTIIPMAAVSVNAVEYSNGYYTYTVTDGKVTITQCKTSISGNIEIPSQLGGYPVTSIGVCAFSGRTLLTSITIPDGVKRIWDLAFNGCTSLTSVTIGNGVTGIGSSAFSDCTSLTSIEIPNSVTSIGNYAFECCTSLTSVLIPKGVTSIGRRAFASTSSLTDLYYGGTKGEFVKVYPTATDDLKFVNIHFDAKVCDAFGHKAVIKNKKTATYFEKGYTGDKVCSVCGEVIEKGKVIAQLKLATPKFSVTAGKKLFKVKYNKVTGATGFQLRYKISGKWTTKNFDTKKTVTKTINKLKRGSKYTVQIRAFKKSGKKIVYSAWSKTQKVKIK